MGKIKDLSEHHHELWEKLMNVYCRYEDIIPRIGLSRYNRFLKITDINRMERSMHINANDGDIDIKIHDKKSGFFGENRYTPFSIEEVGYPLKLSWDDIEFIIESQDKIKDEIADFLLTIKNECSSLISECRKL